jgi:hypothetical protein
MNPITLQHDGKSVTISNEHQRGEFIGTVVSGHVKSGCSTEDAYSLAERDFPQLFSGFRHPKIVMPRKQRPATFSNAAAPVFGNDLKSLFQLPPGATQDACAVAWEANGNQARNFNYVDIFTSLVGWLARQRGLDRAAAEAAVKSGFPELSKMVQTIRGAHPGMFRASAAQ